MFSCFGSRRFPAIIIYQWPKKTISTTGAICHVMFAAMITATSTHITIFEVETLKTCPHYARSAPPLDHCMRTRSRLRRVKSKRLGVCNPFFLVREFSFLLPIRITSPRPKVLIAPFRTSSASAGTRSTP